MESVIVKNERNIGIDIYKILCMFFVIWFHFSDHGTIQITANDEITFNWLILAISRIFGGICNCVFVLCTGYFLCMKKFSLERIIKLWLEVLFYSILSEIIAFVVKIEPFSIKTILRMFMPFTFNVYWYFTDYIILILISPLINLIIDKIDKKQHLCLLIFCFLISTYFPTFEMYHDVSKFSYMFFFLYILAAYLRKYKPEVKFKNSIYGLLGMACFILEILSIFVVRYYNIKYGDNKRVDYFVWGMNK
ncbi:MAG: acyltransferase family protein, partial [Spirochaetales bacterium]|nr:acyltransferase family protein [Spirochaetales bacterium]